MLGPLAEHEKRAGPDVPLGRLRKPGRGRSRKQRIEPPPPRARLERLRLRLLQRARMQARIARVFIDEIRSLSGVPRRVNEAVLTPLGRERLELLERLAGAMVGAPEVQADGWSLGPLDPRALRLELEGEARALTMELSPRREKTPAYDRTVHFNLTFREERGLAGPEGDGARQRLLAALRAAEMELAGEEGFPEALLNSRGAQITLDPSRYRLELRPTLACDHYCGFCNSVDHASTDNVMRGRKEILANLDEWERLTIMGVVISGGEPTLLADLPEVVEALTTRGFSVELQTNGMAFADADYARWLAEVGLDQATISLHSHDAQTSDGSITLHEGGWARTVAGIDHALAQGIHVELSHVIHRANFGGFPDFVRFVHRRWGRRVPTRLAFVAPTGGAGAEVAQHVPPMEDVLPDLLAGLEIARRHDLPIVMVSYCGIPPCLLQPHEAFSEITRRRVAYELEDDHVKLPACTGCVYDSACPGLWRAYHETHGDPGLRAIRVRRPVARWPWWVTGRSRS